MNKEQTARMIQLEERNKALAEEVQALEFEVKDKDKLVFELEGELELCEKIHLVVHDENQLNIRRIKMFKAELQQYKAPVVDRTGKLSEVYSAVSNFMMQDKECYANKTYRVLVIVLEAEDEH